MTGITISIESAAETLGLDPEDELAHLLESTAYIFAECDNPSINLPEDALGLVDLTDREVFILPVHSTYKFPKGMGDSPELGQWLVELAGACITGYSHKYDDYLVAFG